MNGLLGKNIDHENMATEGDGVEAGLLAFEIVVFNDDFLHVLRDAFEVVEHLLDVLDNLDELVDLAAEQF